MNKKDLGILMYCIHINGYIQVLVIGSLMMVVLLALDSNIARNIIELLTIFVFSYWTYKAMNDYKKELEEWKRGKPAKRRKR